MTRLKTILSHTILSLYEKAEVLFIYKVDNILLGMTRKTVPMDYVLLDDAERETLRAFFSGTLLPSEKKRQKLARKYEKYPHTLVVTVDLRKVAAGGRKIVKKALKILARQAYYTPEEKQIVDKFLEGQLVHL